VAHDELHNQLVSVTAKYVALSDQHEETVTQLNDLTEKTKTNSKKMEEMGDTIEAMTDQIKNLHDQIATPIFTGWKSLVQKIVNFLLKTL
jgi:chromosome segregation ATPase